MGILSRLFKREPMPEASAPSGEYPTAVSAIEFLVRAHRGMPDTWVTLNGFTADGTEQTIQVSGETVNLLLEETDLASVLEELGLTALAEVARKTPRLKTGARGGDDPTLWDLPGASVEEVAAVVDALFARHFGLGEGYRLRGWVES